MAIFFFAALTGYFVWQPIARWWISEHDIWFHKHRHTIAGIVAFGLLIITLSAALTPSLESVRHTAFAPQTTQTILGILAGIMCREYRNWISILPPYGVRDTNTSNAKAQEHATNQSTIEGAAQPASESNIGGDKAKKEFGISPTLLFVVALSTLLLGAIAAPYAALLFERTQRFELPFLKIELASRAAEKQIALDIDRNIGIYEKIDDILRASLFTEFDCGYRALETNAGIQEYKTRQEYKRDMNTNANTFAMVTR
jgi:hypothetical protein